MSTDKLPLRARPDDRGRLRLTPAEPHSESCVASVLLYGLLVVVGLVIVAGWAWPR